MVLMDASKLPAPRPRPLEVVLQASAVAFAAACLAYAISWLLGAPIMPSKLLWAYAIPGFTGTIAAHRFPPLRRWIHALRAADERRQLDELRSHAALGVSTTSSQGQT